MNGFRSAVIWLSGIGFIILMFPLTCIIWFLAYPFDGEKRLVHRWLLFQGRFLSRTIPAWKFKVEGLDKITRDQSYVIISNHQSILDIILLNNIRADFRWVSKAENFRVPILGLSMRMAGYISLERGNRESVIRMMIKARETLNSNISVMMFPEGTRSKNKRLLPFKTGAFQLALKTDKPVLPVVINGTGSVLPSKSYRFTGNNKLTIRVLDPVYPGMFETGDPEELAVKFRSLIQEELIKLQAENNRL